jgi:hypothetical protein
MVAGNLIDTLAFQTPRERRAVANVGETPGAFGDNASPLVHRVGRHDGALSGSGDYFAS